MAAWLNGELAQLQLIQVEAENHTNTIVIISLRRGDLPAA